MTIDERLEYIATLQQTHDEQIGRLFEKADQTEEMIRSLGSQMNEAGKRLEIVSGHVDALAGHIGTLTGKLDVLTERTIQAMDAINRLGRIAGNHEDRITHLEDR